MRRDRGLVLGPSHQHRFQTEIRASSSCTRHHLSVPTVMLDTPFYLAMRFFFFFWLLDPQLHPDHTDQCTSLFPTPLPEDYFLSFSSLHFANTCNLIVACAVFGAGTFLKPHSPPSTPLPARTHHLPFLGLFGFVKMSTLILSKRTSLVEVVPVWYRSELRAGEGMCAVQPWGCIVPQEDTSLISDTKGDTLQSLPGA